MASHSFPNRVAHLLLAVPLLLTANSLVAAQSTSSTDGATPIALQPGAPAGSYALSGFDNINLFNGNLNFRLPLLGIAGRGGAGTSITLPIERKWRVIDLAIPQLDGTFEHHYTPVSSWWSDVPRYNVGTLEGRHAVWGDFTCPDNTTIYTLTLTRLTFTAPDGTEYELRDQLTGGKPSNNGNCSYVPPPSRGTVFITADGTAATFISDTTIYDQVISPGGATEFFPSGYLMLRDGTRYRIDNGKVTWLRDRNGNKMSFVHDANGRVTSITDSLNRVTTIVYASGGTLYDQITFKGYGGATRTIRVNYASMSTVLRSGYALKTYGGINGLFPELDGSSSTYFNPSVISSVTLPNNRQYQFKYNSYGELARVVLPTGGAFEYDYASGVEGGYASGVTDFNVYRRVIERRVYEDGTTLEGKTTYSRPEGPGGNAGYVLVDQLEPDGTSLGKTKHYFYGTPTISFNNLPTDYAPWNDGKEYQTEALTPNGATVLRKDVNTFQQRAAVSWWGDPLIPSNNTVEPPNDPRLTQTVKTIEPAAANLVSRQTFEYDDTVPYNNQDNVKEYAFGTGAAGTLVRETRTTFITTSTYTSATTGAHLRSLPSQVSVHDSGGVEKARTTYEYDDYVLDSGHAPLVLRALISGHDAAFTPAYQKRGNPTKVTNWILSPSTQLNTYSQYDIAGNVVKVIDPRGYDTEFNFDDCYGTPNGEAQTNIAPNELATQSQTSYALATSITNALGHVSFAQYDYYLGRAVDAEDVNGIAASGYFSDTLDRPTQVRRAVGTTVVNQTTYAYDDTNRIVTTTSDFDNYNDTTPLKSQTLYDGLGRTTETRQYEGGTNYTAAQTQYDALGRAFKSSNPFRPWQSETVVWTTSGFDALGRVITVTTPDNAVVATSYSGNTLTVTDQAGKKRKSVTDALGRLTQVYEDPTALNYLTAYVYDVLDNLTTVTQGAQTRTFVYDSLKRLKTATNPESGTIHHTYDNNSNLLTKVDARPITTTFTYDALNRPTLKNYSDTTPDVAFFYDSQTLPAGSPSFDRGLSTGRLVAVTTGGTNAGTYRGYDELGQVVRQYQRTDSINYLVEATYNRAGGLLTEKYPAVGGAIRTVTYAYDSAGRVASLNSPLTGYAPAASVSSVSYASHGALVSETLGNSLIHAQVYNNRLQTTHIKLGTSGNPTSVINLTYNYGTTTNNGNVLSTTYAGGGLSYTQTFGYDTLNRLTTSQEGATWSQTNSYDRYGNRAIVGAALSFSATNNRITTAGYTYDAVGNLTNDSTQSFTYDAENKISKVNNVSAYVYDGEGQRVRKLVNENLRFIYDMGGKQIAEFDGATGALQKEYIYGASGLVATIEPTSVNTNGTRYTTSDHLGSPRVVTNSAAGVVSRHDYKPFGEELFAGTGGRTVAQGYGGDNVRQKFTSKERDNETGLDYFLARYYSSTQGRFTSVDPENAGAKPSNPRSWNGYAYTYNNPVNYQDPDGMEVKICGTDGQCTDKDTHLSDDDFNKRFRDDKSIKLKDGKIYKDGEQIGTYRILSIDGAPFSSALIQAGQRPYEKAVLAFAGVSVAGGLLGSVVIPAGSVTTLGLGTTTATSTAVSGVSLTSLSIQQLNLMIRGTQKQLLSELFGQGMAGAQSALASGQIPAGLTRQTLLVAKEIAQRAVGTIKDKGGVQAVRLRVIEEALKKVK